MRYHISVKVRDEMKKRWVKVNGVDQEHPDVFDAVNSMHSAEEVRELLLDLCTPAELEALADRWRVVPFLLRGVPYREIHDLTAVSVTTIGRVARCLTMGEGGYQLAAQRLNLATGSGAGINDMAMAAHASARAESSGNNSKGRQK
jgi:TrpR-related protein YerC/YecD